MRTSARAARALAAVGCVAGLVSAPASAAPSARVFETVTPPGDKGGSDLQTRQAVASPDGNRLLFLTPSVFDGQVVNGQNFYVAVRGEHGWTLQPVTPPDAKGSDQYTARAVSDDFSKVAVEVTPTPTFWSDKPVWVSVGPPGGPFERMASDLAFFNPLTNGMTGEGKIVAATPDLGHVAFQTLDADLVPAAAGTAAGDNLFEWSGGAVRLVNVQDDGQLLGACGAGIAAGVFDSLGYSGSHDANAISDDGSRIFFTSPNWAPFPPTAQCGNTPKEPPQLYLRRNGQATVHVSAAQGVSDPGGHQPALFAGATPDGSVAYFTSTEQLTADDAPDPKAAPWVPESTMYSNYVGDLFRYDAGSGQLRRLSGAGTGIENAGVRWAIVSQDGSTVYYAAEAQLAPGSPASDDAHVNLYRYDDATASTTFVAQVGAGDWMRGADASMAFTGPDYSIGWYVTPDGRHLLFNSKQNLTSYDSGGIAELFRYAADGGELTCVSCPPAGVPATGAATYNAGVTLTYNRPGRPMSDDGAYVFFESPDQVAPTSAAPGKRSVFEWHDGKVRLISGGRDNAGTGAVFLTASADGRDAFFMTHEGLVTSDVDGLGDIYDARIGGGFPEPPQPPAPCDGDDCQGAPNAAPPASKPASATMAAGTPAAGPPKAVAFRVAKPSAAQLKALARTGRLRLRVTVGAGGTVTVKGTAGGRTVASGHRTLRAKGTARVPVALSRAARQRLAHGGRLRLVLTARFSRSSATHTVRLSLGGRS